tara:strand:- start:525 stop:818 length:294 start_codon:yes stop_codon:yes gene_type:complete
MNKLIIVIIVFLTIIIVENDAKKLKCSRGTYKPRTCETKKFHLLPDWIREIEMKNIKSEQKKVGPFEVYLFRSSDGSAVTRRRRRRGAIGAAIVDNT